jgi:hypothetical protein
MTCACDGTSCDCSACDACAGTEPETPETITNRPALGQISYRTGRYATFLASMLAGLSSSDPTLAPLGALRTRDPSDFSIALLDSWATVLDILTFYSERLANEAFLRTAVDRRSVTDLAALVGYVPSPGVAASATLAFTLATAPGSPASVLIPAGTRVQSVPGPGQTAQVFETSADLTALAAWNALPAQTTEPWSLCGTEQSTWIAGTSNNISVGDALLFVYAPGGVPSVTSGLVEFHYVTAVSTDPVAKATQLTWDAPLSTTEFASGASMYVFRKKAALFGANAPSPQTLTGPYVWELKGWPGSQPAQGILGPLPSDPGPAGWNYQYDGGAQVNLDAIYPGLTPPAADGGPQWLVLTGPTVGDIVPLDPPNASEVVTTVVTIDSATDMNPGLYALASRVTVPTVDNPQVLLGGAPPRDPVTGAVDPITGPVDDFLGLYIGLTPRVTAYVQSAQLTGAALPLTDWTSVDGLYPTVLLLTVTRLVPLERPPSVAARVGPVLPIPVRWEPTGVPAHPPGKLAPVAGSAVAVLGGQQVPAGQPAAISGKRLRLQVAASPPGGTPGPTATFTPAGSSGASNAAGQVFLIDVFPPTIDAAGNTTWSVITVSGVAGALAVPVGSALTYLPADNADPLASEAVIVQGAIPKAGLTTLALAMPLARIYDPSTVTVNANAVLATNGETVQEILGSGDATNPGLSFTLKQAPLTYLTAPVSSGAQSTLQVWVNNLRWQEAPNLLTAGTADRVYTTSVNAAGNTVVQFGDGTNGERTPTGQANIRAVYRKGIGSAGMVATGQVSQPLDRPQGLSGVTNPSAATGAADPATADEIREIAPLPTLTISRVVSLEDYQNYALAFAGIAMALATWTWFGDLRGVFLTIAGANGATLASDDPIVSSLTTALRQYSDPNVPLTIVPDRPVLFTFAASVAVDTTTYDPSAVLTQAWQDVSAAFAFGQRSLGQGVAASEIIEVIQGVPGVLAVQLTGLQRSGQPATAGSVLQASGPQPPTATQPALGAELLLLDPATQGQIGGWS